MHHSLERYHSITHELRDPRLNIPRKDFMTTLYKLGNDKCVEYLGESIKENKDDFKFCRNEVMVASSCVYLNKANNLVGDMRDNVGLCAFEIKYAKEQLKQRFNNFPFEKMDEWLRLSSLSTKNIC